jgi:NADH dehydrogenase (ubiquinone) Fe-S protein 1
MEFILANHPLDCPICDQGGECDLQDISVKYGYKTGRFDEYKRAVEDKNIGPLISTIMNRCIHCTRCIRFSQEVAGVFDLGTVGRGTHTEIGTYVNKMVTSELSGNLVDLCPVGALTNAPYAFTSRPWELCRTSSIDLMEGIIPSVEFDFRGPEIMRVLPMVNEKVNMEWISDKSRYSYDGLKRQRLSFPLKKNVENFEFEEIKWEVALQTIAKKLMEVETPESSIVGLIGEFASVEAITVLKDLLNGMNCDNFMYDNFPFQNKSRSDYLLNRTLVEIEKLDTLLLVGSNPKLESPVFNARILKAVNQNKLKVYKIGPAEDLNYEYVHLGNNTSIVEEIVNGKHPFSKVLNNSKNGHILVGSGLASYSKNANLILQSLKGYARKINEINPECYVSTGVLHNFVGPINGYELGLQYKSIQESDKMNIVINLGNDNINFLERFYSQKKAFTIYIGTHGDVGASYADIVLPAAAWSEQNGTYVSTEGRVQSAKLAVLPPALAKENWMILRALGEEIGLALNYDNQEELRFRISEFNPALLKYDFIEPYSVFDNPPSKINLENEKLISTVDNFYKTDCVSRSSVVMSKCSAAFNKDKMINFLNPSIFK